MGKTKVLVIDDELIILDSVKKILAQENYEVAAFPSSKDGLNSALHKDYDIVLTDIRMPEIGGMRILRDIKRAKPAVPVVILTGYATVKYAVQAMKLGATDYIEKPFTPDELLEAIGSAIHTAAQSKPEEQKIIHKYEMLKVLEKAAVDMILFQTYAIMVLMPLRNTLLPVQKNSQSSRVISPGLKLTWES